MNNDWKNGFEFDEGRHIYTLDGKPLTGVTTILGVKAKPALIQWAANEAVKFVEERAKVTEPAKIPELLPLWLKDAKTAHRAKKEGAADFGTNVHLAIENQIKSLPLPKLSPEETTAFYNFNDWTEKNKAKFLESELRIYSKKHWYAGTCDFVAEIDGKIWIGDIKTSSNIYPEYFWQTSAYQLAMQELGLYPNIEGHVIVNVKKDGRVEVERSWAYERNVRGFLACLEIYRIDEALKDEMGKK